ncbi:uncharacterized protein LOC111628798 [Centruroides sculpturatus]|uniref:uncharacterized protein LOC111628798 n=1 Tax=Centruroides sculpturatus TaxID=218467 RepID=UPI000C6D830C|nr:uncharacterized protein LOC111628798 [Centruroides sculpturatus]
MLNKFILLLLFIFTKSFGFDIGLNIKISVRHDLDNGINNENIKEQSQKSRSSKILSYILKFILETSKQIYIYFLSEIYKQHEKTSNITILVDVSVDLNFIIKTLLKNEKSICFMDKRKHFSSTENVSNSIYPTTFMRKWRRDRIEDEMLLFNWEQHLIVSSYVSTKFCKQIISLENHTKIKNEESIFNLKVENLTACHHNNFSLGTENTTRINLNLSDVVEYPNMSCEITNEKCIVFTFEIANRNLYFSNITESSQNNSIKYNNVLDHQVALPVTQNYKIIVWIGTILCLSIICLCFYFFLSKISDQKQIFETIQTGNEDEPETTEKELQNNNLQLKLDFTNVMEELQETEEQSTNKWESNLLSMLNELESIENLGESIVFDIQSEIESIEQLMEIIKGIDTKYQWIVGNHDKLKRWFEEFVAYKTEIEQKLQLFEDCIKINKFDNIYNRTSIYSTILES